jgi:hypothetical protein
MAVWAYECRGGEDGQTVWFVSQQTVDEMPPDVRAIRVKVGSEWLSAVVDRSRPIAVEGMLVRPVLADETQQLPPSSGDVPPGSISGGGASR